VLGIIKQGSRQQLDSVLQKIAEANLEPVDKDRLSEGARVALE